MKFNLENIKIKIDKEFNIINLNNNEIINDIYLNNKNINFGIFKATLNDILEFENVQLEQIEFLKLLHISSEKQLEYVKGNQMKNSYKQKDVVKYKLNGKEQEVTKKSRVTFRTKRAKIFDLINSVLKENNFNFTITSQYQYESLKEIINNDKLRKLFQKTKRKEKFNNIFKDAGIE